MVWNGDVFADFVPAFSIPSQPGSNQYNAGGCLEAGVDYTYVLIYAAFIMAMMGGCIP